jgi:hypothetical protein
MFCLWSVAKPNYYLPCLPGAALLCGIEWVRLTRAARAPRPNGELARRVLQGHWVVFFAAGGVVPVVFHETLPHAFTWSILFGAALATGVVASARAWRLGYDAGALAPMVAALAVGVLIGYGGIAPPENDRRSHRELAATIDRLLPPESHTVMFFHELDEGLWFYLRDRTLEPVPGSQPEYNDAFRFAEDLRYNRLEWDPEKRADAQQHLLVEWIDGAEHPSPYVLIRRDKYERFAAALGDRVEPLHGEDGLKRNELVLLRVTTPKPVAAAPASGRRQ